MLHNDAALFPWLMSGWFSLGMVMMTGIVIRDGLPDNINLLFAIAILAFFWAGAIGLGRWAFRLKRIRVEVEQGQGRLIQISPLGKEITPFTRREVERIGLVESADSDGDPYFSCMLVLYQMVEVRAAEGHDRAVVESAAWRLRQSLGMVDSY